MADAVRKTPEGAETRFGEALASRDAAVASLGGSRGLGPPDLCWVQKSARGLLRRKSSDLRGYYHWVLGLDVSSSASVAAYFASMAAGMEKVGFLQGLLSAKDYTVERGIYCCYDPFSQLDVWCDMCVPGGVVARAVNSVGDLFDLTPEIWRHVHVAAFLRSQLYDAATVSSSKAVRHLDPFPTAREEASVLEVLLQLYQEGTVQECLDRLHWDKSKGVCAEDMDIVAATVMHYFGRTHRWQQALEFFRKLHEHHPLAAIYIAAVQGKLGNSDEASSTLKEAEGTCTGSDAAALTVGLGWDRLRNDQVGLAEEMARKALESDILIRPAWTLLINCLVKKKEYASALQALNSMPPPIMDASRKELLFHVIPPPPKGMTKPVHPQYNPEVEEFRQISYEARAPGNLIQSLPAEVIVPWGPEGSAAAPEVAPSHAMRAIVRSSFNLLFEIVECIGWNEFVKVQAAVFSMPAALEDAVAEEAPASSGLLRSVSASEIQRILFQESFVKLEAEPQPQRSLTRRLSQHLGAFVEPITGRSSSKEATTCPSSASPGRSPSMEGGATNPAQSKGTAVDSSSAVPVGDDPPAPVESTETADAGNQVVDDGQAAPKVDGQDGTVDESGEVQEPTTPQGVPGESLGRILARGDDEDEIERCGDAVPEPRTPWRSGEVGVGRDGDSDFGDACGRGDDVARLAPACSIGNDKDRHSEAEGGFVNLAGNSCVQHGEMDVAQTSLESASCHSASNATSVVSKECKDQEAQCETQSSTGSRSSCECIDGCSDKCGVEAPSTEHPKGLRTERHGRHGRHKAQAPKNGLTIQSHVADDGGNEADMEDDDGGSCDWQISPHCRPGHVAELAAEPSNTSQELAAGFGRPPRQPVGRKWKADHDAVKSPAAITRQRMKEMHHILPHNIKDRVKYFQALVEEKEVVKATQPWTMEKRQRKPGSMSMAEFLTLGWSFSSDTETSVQGNPSPRPSAADSEALSDDAESGELEDGTVEGTVSRYAVKTGWHSMDTSDWKGPGHRIGSSNTGDSNAVAAGTLGSNPFAAGPSTAPSDAGALSPTDCKQGLLKVDGSSTSECSEWLVELICALLDDLATYSMLAHFDKKLKSELGCNFAEHILGTEEKLPEPDWQPALGDLDCESPRDAEAGEAWGTPHTNQRDWLRRALLCQRLHRQADAEQAYRACLMRGFNLTALLALSKIYAGWGLAHKCMEMLNQVAHFHNGRHEFAKDPYTPHSFVYPVGKLVRVVGPQEVRDASLKYHPLVQHAVQQVLRCLDWGTGEKGNKEG